MEDFSLNSLVLRVLKPSPYNELNEEPETSEKRFSDVPLKNSEDTDVNKETSVMDPTSKSEGIPKTFLKDRKVTYDDTMKAYRKDSEHRLPKDRVVMGILYGHKHGKGFDPRNNPQIPWIRQYTKAISHVCKPFKLGPRIAPSGRSIKFKHPGLLHIWIPILNHIGITVRDLERGESRFFDLRVEAGGWFPFLRYLTDKAHAHEQKYLRSGTKVRSTMRSAVLIKNAKRVDKEITREQWYLKRGLNLLDYNMCRESTVRISKSG